MCRITVKNLKKFYSMEYGEGGAFSCDIYFDGKKQGFFVQEGNGGPFMYQPLSKESMNEKALNDYAKEYFSKNEFARFLSSCSEEDCKLDWLIDLEYIVLLWDDLKSIKKEINSFVKKGYDKSFAIIRAIPQPLEEQTGLYQGYILASRKDLTDEVVKVSIKKNYENDSDKYGYYIVTSFEDVLSKINSL